MKFFKNPIVAVFLAIIIVAASLVLNTKVKLGERCQAVEDQFYTSEAGAKSIYTRLDSRLDAANGLWSVVQGYHNGAAIDLSNARLSLIDAMEDRDVSAMYSANSLLQSAFDAAVSALGGYSLSDNEQRAFEDYKTAFSGSQKMIDESNYNANVLEFQRKTLNKFPASLLAPIAGVDAPDMFA